MTSLSQGVAPGLIELFSRPQFSIDPVEREALLLNELLRLVRHHAASCDAYRRIIAGVGWQDAKRLVDLPYLPVSLFKTHTLSSIPNSQVFKTMTSSGTTGQAVSKVLLDRHTAELQSKALAAVMGTVLGAQRMPMIIIDSPAVLRNRNEFSARGAGILGMMPFGRSHMYALDDNMRLNIGALRDFLAKHQDQPVLLFGFTFMVWKHFAQALADSGEVVDLFTGILIHSGGWKNLTDQAVGNAEFKKALAELTGLRRVHNFYGMVEQVGSVFLEGEDGFLYPPNMADVIIRDPVTWQEAPNGTPGVIEVLSALPHSYPGHVLLTEDLGVVHGIGTSSSGWVGKQLQVLGRVPHAELRGCSDTHAVEATALAASAT